MLIILEVHYLFEGEIILTCPINYAKFPFHSATCKQGLCTRDSSRLSPQRDYFMEPHPSRSDPQALVPRRREFRTLATEGRKEGVHSVCVPSDASQLRRSVAPPRLTRNVDMALHNFWGSSCDQKFRYGITQVWPA